MIPDAPPVFCVKCHAPIDPSWAFCGICGADNRPPESHPPISPHVHRYSPGFCPTCGAGAMIPTPLNSSDGAYTYYPSIFQPKVGLAVLALCVISGVLGYTFEGPKKFLNEVSSPFTWAPVTVLCLLALLGDFQLTLDTRARKVRSVRGFHPFVTSKEWRFDDIHAFVLSSHLDPQRPNPQYPYNDLNIMMESGEQVLVMSTISDRAETECKKLAAALQKPYQDVRSDVY